MRNHKALKGSKLGGVHRRIMSTKTREKVQQVLSPTGLEVPVKQFKAIQPIIKGGTALGSPMDRSRVFKKHKRLKSNRLMVLSTLDKRLDKDMEREMAEVRSLNYEARTESEMNYRKDEMVKTIVKQEKVRILDMIHKNWKK